jgi:hypothetical protein
MSGREDAKKEDVSYIWGRKCLGMLLKCSQCKSGKKRVNGGIWLGM